MFHHIATYTDFNGKKKTEDLYFNIMAPELADLEFNPMFEDEGGLADYLRKAMESDDRRKVYTFFKLLIVNSYGRRTEDGEYFLKKPEWTDKFLNSAAYEEFFMWLLDNNTKNAQKFWTEIMPQKIIAKAEELDKSLAGKKNITDLSREELLALIEKRDSESTNKAIEA